MGWAPSSSASGVGGLEGVCQVAFRGEHRRARGRARLGRRLGGRGAREEDALPLGERDVGEDAPLLDALARVRVRVRIRVRVRVRVRVRARARVKG